MASYATSRPSMNKKKNVYGFYYRFKSINQSIKYIHNWPENMQVVKCMCALQTFVLQVWTNDFRLIENDAI